MERDHQEFQKLGGCFVFDVFKSFPGKWVEMLPFLELCRNNPPCSVTGVTPRDLDRAWSITTPLERELLPADRGALVSISDHAVS